MLQEFKQTEAYTSYYQHISDEQLQKLLDFRKQFPYQQKDINGLNWRFLDTKQGEQTLLILPGASVKSEISFHSLQRFAQTYRVITIDYPPVSTITVLLEGLLYLLDERGIDHFFLMGGSYGGWMAQSLVRRCPERIDKLIISAVGPPNPQNSQTLKKMSKWLRLLPTFVLKTMLNRSFANLDLSAAEEYPQLELLWAQMKEVMNQLTRRDIFALFERLIDQTEKYDFTPNDLKHWPGRMLFLFGSDDPATPPERIESMRELYPKAHIEVFQGGSHGIAVTHQDEYFEMIERFLGN